MENDSVKVCDEEIEQLIEIAKQWEEINHILGKYVEILKEVKDSTIKEGEIHNAIETLYSYAKEMYTYSVGLGSEVAKDAKAFLSKIEDIDLDLYNGV